MTTIVIVVVVTTAITRIMVHRRLLHLEGTGRGTDSKNVSAD